jgi:AcrR family transcriptional regulator
VTIYASSVSKTRSSTRERILDAALDLFIERGVTGTTVSDIERAVGLAAGTGSFYRHFRSKEDAVVPSFERRVRRLADEGEAERAALPPIEDPAERRTRECVTLLAEMRRFQPLWILTLSEREQFPELGHVFVETLGIRTWDFGWEDDPGRAIVVAALVGFGQLVFTAGAVFGGIDEREFIAELVAAGLAADLNVPLFGG